MSGTTSALAYKEHPTTNASSASRRRITVSPSLFWHSCVFPFLFPCGASSWTRRCGSVRGSEGRAAGAGRITPRSTGAYRPRRSPIERVDAVEDTCARRGAVVAAAQCELAGEEARAARAERELHRWQAVILSNAVAEHAGLHTGPCATTCASAWRDVGALRREAAGTEGRGQLGGGTLVAQEAEAALASALVETKAGLMARTAAATEAAHALSAQTARGGLRMDSAAASQQPDFLTEA